MERGACYQHGSNRYLAKWEWEAVTPPSYIPEISLIKPKTWTTKVIPAWKNTSVIIGIDPGSANLAVCRITPNKKTSTISVTKGRLLAKDSDLLLMEVAYNYIDGIIRYYNPSIVWMEGAAHGKTFGREHMEEIRVSMLLSAHKGGSDTGRVAPMTARKNVLGYGRWKGIDMWPGIDANASDAVVIALDGLGYRWKEN